MKKEEEEDDEKEKWFGCERRPRMWRVSELRYLRDYRS
jgi:hypothetical protein